ncbi:uncharacterized protein M6B38_401250 [Iris pallida]|uniref:Uncharacterized protein n=1 Tax=Iris pallida TaxID=29817 RepID=A0AAX6FUB4_IRIPA|nr:uncharacterized protein M6B38_401250 [Iris pallida]
MGQGEELKTRPDPKVEIQERGDIFFFYRPKVSKEEAHSADDVQRLYIVLHPESGEQPVEEKQASDSGKEGEKISGDIKEEEGQEKKGGDNEDTEEEAQEKKGGDSGAGVEGGHGSEKVNIEKQPLFRFIVMGRKSLPDPHKKGRPYWGFVEMVTTKTDDIKIALQGEEYDTATRGHRHKPPARALAEGVYRILRHQPSNNRKAHTHLIYKLELPAPGEKHEPQGSLNIEREASLLLQIKNPEHKGTGSSGQFRGLREKRKALFPASLQGRLGHLRFAPADPPDFLNYEGCEFLLIAASDDLDEELGLELRTEAEEVRSEKSCSDLIQMFGEAGSSKPLLSGTWV